MAAAPDLSLGFDGATQKDACTGRLREITSIEGRRPAMPARVSREDSATSLQIRTGAAGVVSYRGPTGSSSHAASPDMCVISLVFRRQNMLAYVSGHIDCLHRKRVLTPLRRDGGRLDLYYDRRQGRSLM